MFIDDPLSGARASVDKESNRLNVSARTNPRIFYVSRDQEEAYVWTSTFNASTGNEIISVQNTSKTKRLFISEIVTGAGAAGLMEVNISAGTAGGTTITAVNLNADSPKDADAVSFGNAAVTGLTPGLRFGAVRVPANQSVPIPYGGALSLGQGDTLSITYTGSGTATSMITGYFE